MTAPETTGTRRSTARGNWRLPVLAVTGVLAIAIAGGAERSRSCSARGGTSGAFGTHCDPPVLRVRGVAPPSAQDLVDSATSYLAFEPQFPAPGGVVSATFTTRDAAMAAEPRVVLRARLRSDDEPMFGERPRIIVLGVLHAVGGGRFIGSFRVPADATYARLAVESEHGDLVDANAAQLFELLTGAEDGQPSYESLIGRARDHLMNDPAMLIETGRLLQHLNPARPWGWYVRLGGEGTLAGREREAEFDAKSARLFHRYDARLRRMEKVAAADMDLMRNWTRTDFSNEGQHYWTERVNTEHPGGCIGSHARSDRVYLVTMKDRAAYLDSLDAMWASSACRESSIVASGWLAAQMDGDAERLALWLSRWPFPNALGRIHMDERRAAEPAFRELSERRLRAYLDTLQLEDLLPREPGETRAEVRREQELARQAARAALARVLTATERPVEALRVLGEDSRALFDSSYFIARALARIAAGDHVGAQSDYVLAAAADEGLVEGLADSTRAIAGATFDRDAWNQRVGAARAVRDSLLLASPPGASIAGYVVQANDRTEHRVADIAGGSPMVIAVIRVNTLTGGTMAQADGVAHGLSAAGVRWMYLDIDSRPVETSIAAPWHEHASIHRDVNGTLRSVLEPRLVPQYYLIDASGRLRFTTRDLREVHDFALALSRN